MRILVLVRFLVIIIVCFSDNDPNYEPHSQSLPPVRFLFDSGDDSGPEHT